MQNSDSNHVSRELLTYLARIPKTLQENGPDCAGEIAVALGNALLWLSPSLEPGIAPAENPIHETPQTLYALGKQLRQVGLELWDKRNQKRVTRLDELERQIANVEAQVTRLGGVINLVNLNTPLFGGAK